MFEPCEVLIMKTLRVPWIIAAVFAVLAVVTMFAGAPAVQAGAADEATAVATFTPVDVVVAGDIGQVAYLPIAQVGSAGHEGTFADEQIARMAENGFPRLGADGAQSVDATSTT